jgi:DNA-nicking Smr family endonuclease
MASPPEAGEPLKFLRPGHAPDLLRKLRRGHWRVQDELDLHGLNRMEAGRAIADFLDSAVSQGMRCLRIVHGKGAGVLRETLRAVLPGRVEVLAFVEAPPDQGGSGAALVLLKS